MPDEIGLSVADRPQNDCIDFVDGNCHRRSFAEASSAARRLIIDDFLQ
jgi:hypothetical protein